MTAVAVALLAVCGWYLFVLGSPVRKCSWCKGTLRAKKHRYWGRTVGCPKCKGTRRHYRLGAAFVHRTFRSARDEIRQRREQK